ncbi:MAG: HAMP domain-containing histidine kinase [Candidatus Competibacteraceae bacterium]|nr:HAMP domain-containing histidine kinase [Candidatus Competibacteraceae bacterium]
MNIYQDKKKWKLWLGISAAVIVASMLVYSQWLVQRIANEEKDKMELWAQAVQNRAILVNKTDSIFRIFEAEDRKNISLWAEANKFIAEYEGDGDIYFPTRILSNNTTIPVIITNEKDEILFFNNFPVEREEDTVWLSEQLTIFKQQNRPIDVSYKVLGKTIRQYLYYDDSYIFRELKNTIDNLVQSFISETVINSASVPVIITNHTQDSIVSFGNLEEMDLDISDSHERIISTMKGYNVIEIELTKGHKNYIYYRDSNIIRLLKYFPLVFLSIIAGFLLVSYLLFSTARRNEQNQVWVGMSKETAHQLGTPLTSLMGWSEILREKGIDVEITKEIEKDIERLQVVAERFSKIGSTPELQEENLDDTLRSIIDYMRKRSSSKIEYIYQNTRPTDETIPLNRPLFEWVMENLIRNAIDAIQGPGTISIQVSDAGKYVAVDICDSGKGISKGMTRAVFRPGYTTKKRGWGLGLSLTKRIIENYHKGKIFVKLSEPGKGTTFRILLRY